MIDALSGLYEKAPILVSICIFLVVCTPIIIAILRFLNKKHELNVRDKQNILKYREKLDEQKTARMKHLRNPERNFVEGAEVEK